MDEITEEYKDKKTMYQQPVVIPKIINMTTEMLEKERAIDPFLPEMPKLFFERNITSMLMKIGTDINGNPSMGTLNTEEYARKLLEEVIERLYNLENEDDVEFEKNTKDLDKSLEVETKDIIREEVTYLKSTSEYTHPQRRFQPPIDIPKVVWLTTDLLKEEEHINPFLPEVPKRFFAKYLDTMLKKIDQNLYRNGCPRLRQMKSEEIASRLLDEAIEKLYIIEQDLEKENKEMENMAVEINNIVVEEKLQHEDKSNNGNDCEIKNKKKWSFRSLFRYFIPCINKKEN